MKAWTEWEIIRRQVAIGGRIRDEDDRPAAGVRITLISMPGKYKRLVKTASVFEGGGWDGLEQCMDRVISCLDGIYFFLDLPAGRYTLEVFDHRSDKHATQHVTVVWDKKKNIKMSQADFRIPAD